MAAKIIIFSGKQYSGKDTVAKIMLAEMKDYKRCAMGDIIKLTYGEQKGLTYEEIEKNKPLYRQDLINLGNWGRAQDPDYWLKKIIKQDGNIMVTDVRVPHEYEVFKNAGAITIRVEASRNFANKLWNASRFVFMNIDEEIMNGVTRESVEDNLTIADKWIISRANRVAKEVTENMDKFDLGIAATKVEDFAWSECCDWFL